LFCVRVVSTKSATAMSFLWNTNVCDWHIFCYISYS